MNLSSSDNLNSFKPIVRGCRWLKSRHPSSCLSGGPHLLKPLQAQGTSPSIPFHVRGASPADSTASRELLPALGTPMMPTSATTRISRSTHISAPASPDSARAGALWSATSQLSATFRACLLSRDSSVGKVNDHHVCALLPSVKKAGDT